MTECNQSQFEFEAHFSRRVVAEFSGERLTTEGGALLLRGADRKIGLLRRVVTCFSDARDPQRIEHELGEMLAQRVYGFHLAAKRWCEFSQQLTNTKKRCRVTGSRTAGAFAVLFFYFVTVGCELGMRSTSVQIGSKATVSSSTRRRRVCQ